MNDITTDLPKMHQCLDTIGEAMKILEALMPKYYIVMIKHHGVCAELRDKPEGIKISIIKE